MANYAEYFERIGYKPKYYIGDRVFGHYEKIPFVGTVGNDRLISPITGPEITVQLDLPILTKNGVRSIITVRHKDIKPLKDYDDDSGLHGRSKKT